jgi:hypothetical protein
MPIPSIAIGSRAQKGGAVMVALALDQGEPRLLFSTFLTTHAEGDRLAFEPYHVAVEMVRDGHGIAAAEAAVIEARGRQERLAADGLRTAAVRIAGNAPVRVALLVNRAGWMTDLLQYSLAWPDHPPVAEGLAVRDALRFACRDAGIEAAELDEKSLAALASERLGLSPAEIDARLRPLGKTAGPPWRKEQKFACLAAWVTLVERA